MKKLSKKYFEKDAVDLAKDLLGKVIEFNGCKAMIVETEAYKDDQASHGRTVTPRSEIMLSTHGHVYVYLIYGMYNCLNFTTNKGKVGAVLIRSLEPLEGIKKMERRRKTNNLYNLCSGPGKLCQAFGITKEVNKHLVNKHIKIYSHKNLSTKDIVSTKRIGITKAVSLPWRFYIKGNKFVSKF